MEFEQLERVARPLSRTGYGMYCALQEMLHNEVRKLVVCCVGPQRGWKTHQQNARCRPSTAAGASPRSTVPDPDEGADQWLS